MPAFKRKNVTYRPVLELHGWDFGPELTALSKRGKWVEMGERIDEEVLETFAIVAAPEDVGAELERRYADTVDTWLATFQPSKAETCAALLAAVRA